MAEALAEGESVIKAAHGEFRVEQFIGAGKFGSVFKAKNLTTYAPVCCKKIEYSTIKGNPTWDLRRKETNDKAEFEVQCLLWGMRHRNIVQYCDYVQVGEYLWVFMELCLLGDLRDYIRGHRCALAAEELLPIFVDTASAISFLHKNEPPIIHRNIKLQNFLVQLKGRKVIVKLGDFEMSRLFTSEGSTAKLMQTFGGTSPFMAPEYFDEETGHQYDVSGDIFALGMVFTALLTYKGNEDDFVPKSYNARKNKFNISYGLEVLWKSKLGEAPPAIFPPSEVDDGLTAHLKSLVIDMVQACPSDRPTATRVLESLKDRLTSSNTIVDTTVQGYDRTTLTQGVDVTEVTLLLGDDVEQRNQHLDEPASVHIQSQQTMVQELQHLQETQQTGGAAAGSEDAATGANETDHLLDVDAYLTHVIKKVQDGEINLEDMKEDFLKAARKENPESHYTILSFLTKVEKEAKLWKKAQVNIAITGISGSGKSTLINALRGLVSSNEPGYAQTSGVVEGTMKCKVYTYPWNKYITLWDLPGIDSRNFPRDKYLKKTQFKSYDFYIIVTDKRFTESDAFLIGKIDRRKKYAVVRSQFEYTLTNTNKGKREEDKVTADILISEVKDSVIKNTKLVRENIFVIDSLEPAKYEFSKLKHFLSSNLANEHQQQAFIYTMPIHSKKDISLKKEELMKQMWRVTTRACFVGLIPVPFLDMKRVQTILLESYKKYLMVFCLDEDRLHHWARKFSSDAVEVSKRLKKVRNKQGLPTTEEFYRDKPKQKIDKGETGVLEDFATYLKIVLGLGTIPGSIIGAVAAREYAKTVLGILLDKCASSAEELLSELQELETKV